MSPPLDIWEWAPPAIFLLVTILVMSRLARGPSPKTQRYIELALRAKGLELVGLNFKSPGLRLGKSSRIVIVARGRNSFGNFQTEYFSVDMWAEVLRRSTVTELGMSGEQPFL